MVNRKLNATHDNVFLDLFPVQNFMLSSAEVEDLSVKSKRLGHDGVTHGAVFFYPCRLRVLPNPSLEPFFMV